MILETNIEPELKTSKQNKINQLAYIIEAGLEYFISILVTGAFLASILSYNGVSDKVTGITTALASFGYTAQAVAVLFIRPKTKGKKMVILLHTLNQLMFAALYMTPFIKVSQGVKTTLFIILFLGGNLIANVASPFKLSWMMSYVDDSTRGIFTARKEVVSLIGGMIFSYAMGGISDYFKSIGKDDIGFFVCGITVFMLCVSHTISMLVVKDDKNAKTVQQERKKYTLKSVLDITVLDSRFRKIIYLDIMWHVASSIVSPFLGTYQINELGFSLTYVAVIAIIGSVARVMFSGFFGRYADKHSWAKMLTVVFFIGAMSYLVNSFTNPSNGKIFYVLFLVLNGIFYAGSNSGLMNVAFDYVKHEDRAAALGIKTAIGGIMGFSASLIGSQILSTVQENGNMVFGITIYAQQILSFIAFIVMMCIVIYINKIICKMKKNI